MQRYSELLRTILEKRGIKTQALAEIFLNPDYERDLHNPFKMKDMEKACVKLFEVIENKEGLIPKTEINVNWKEDLELVKSTCAKGTTDSEFKLFCYTANLYSLNPLKKEIWAVKYGYSPANIMVGRDGYLTIAHKSGQFNGMKTEYFSSKFDKELDKIKTHEQRANDSYAECTVYRKDMEHPITVRAYYKEYFNEKSPVWKDKPITMICKVAESQALRKAFNVSGVYDPDEFRNTKKKEESGGDVNGSKEGKQESSDSNSSGNK